MSVSEEEIKHIAELAKLEFSGKELKRFEGEFNNILDYISQIQECDTKGIEFEHNLQNYSGKVLQEDIPQKSLPVEKLMMNATDGRNKQNYIRTSKMISKE